jgi:hypothetical protein
LCLAGVTRPGRACSGALAPYLADGPVGRELLDLLLELDDPHLGVRGALLRVLEELPDAGALALGGLGPLGGLGQL